MEAAKIKEFVERVLPELDAPAAYLPHINQYVTKEEQWGEDKTRMCYIMPVPQSASVQNLGIAILANICNEKMGPEFMSTRAYYPEPKMLKRMKKENIPFFDSCIYHEMKDYDCIGFSSFYALQYLAFIPLLKLSNIPYKFEDRRDNWDYPIVGLGGIQTYSAEPVAPIFDVFFLGEGEVMNEKFLRLLRQRKKEGVSRKEFLYEAARDIQGIVLPWAYEWEYYPADHPTKPNQIKSYRLTEEAAAHGIPLINLKACIEFRDTDPLTKTFVPNEQGGEMSIGSVYTCNSCSNLCSFCQGSHISLPLRERPLEKVLPATEELIKETGTKEITPYSFNVSDLSYVNRFTKSILADQNKKVSLSSERLDMFNEDFALTTLKSGARSLTVAVEAASPRGRHILNKNLTEEQILKAFEIIFKLGFQKVKIYNIASYPFETEEDRMYYPKLAAKLNELREKYGAKTMLRWSWTGFQAKPFTPLQYAPMEGVSMGEDGEVIFNKTYNNMLDALKEVSPKDRVRFGTASGVSIVAQALAFGDRRLFPVIEKCVDHDVIKYLGGMGIGNKEAVPAFTKLMKEYAGLGWDYFIREKDEDEIFPWEYLSTGVDKSWLLMIYKMAKEAANTPVDQEGLLRAPCHEKCTVCGVCRSKERKPDNFWPAETYGEGRWLPKFEWPDREADNIDVHSVLDSYVKQQKLRTLRFELDINPKYRYVDGSKFKFRMRRALFRVGVPIMNQMIASSDKILEKAWFCGKEIYEVYIADKRYDINTDEILRRVNEELSDDAFVVTRVEQYSGEVQALRDNFEYVLYSMTLRNEDFSIASLKEELAKFEAAEHYPIKVKVKSTTQRDTIRVQELNAKDYAYKVFVRQNEDNTFTLFAALSANVAMYDFATALLKTAKRTLYRFPAIVEEYMLKNTGGATLDMFADVCADCGEEIELNIWGESIDPAYCLEHKYLNSFQHRAGVDSKFEEIEDADEESVELGGHDDDDDDDISAKYEGNEGI